MKLETEKLNSNIENMMLGIAGINARNLEAGLPTVRGAFPKEAGGVKVGLNKGFTHG